MTSGKVISRKIVNTNSDLIKGRQSWQTTTKLALAIGAMTGLLSSRIAHADSNYLWDPSATGTGSDGSNSWDTTTVDWSNDGAGTAWDNDGSATAIFGDGGTAGTATINALINANALTFNAVTGNYTIAATSGDTLTLGNGSNGLITLATGVAPTISATIAGSGGVTVMGAGQLTLSGSNTFTGGLTINGSQVNYTNDVSSASQLGAIGQTVSLTNGGILNYAGTVNLTTTRVVSVSGSGTLELQNSFTNTGGSKVILSNANQITGSGTLTATGDGIFGIGASNSFTGSWILNGDYFELTNATAMGAATDAITVNTNGEISAKNINFANPLTLSGGTIGSDSGSGGTFSGTIAVSANSKIRVADFYDSIARNVTITGTISGSGNLTLVNGPSVTPSNTNPFPVSGAPNGEALLILSGNNAAGYTGNLIDNGGSAIRFANITSIPVGGNPVNGIDTTGTVITLSNTTSLPIVTVGFNGSSAIPTIVNNTAGTSEGVFGASSVTTTVAYNMTTIGGGSWFFGTDGGGVSYDAVITPGTGHVYRIAGGGGNLFLGTSNSLGSAGTGGAIIGDTRLGGTGTVRFGASQSYSGTTTVNAGTIFEMDFANSGPTSNLMPSTSALILAGGTFNNSNKTTLALSQTVAGTTINPGGSSAITAVDTIATNTMVFKLGVITRNTGGTVNFTNPTFGTLSTTNGILTNTPNAYGAILGGYSVVSGGGWATSAGTSGTAGLITALPTYNSGGSAFSTGFNTDASTGTTTPGTMTINSLRFNTAGAYTLSDSGGSGDTLTITSGGILETSTVGANAVTISPANLATGNGTDLIINQYNTAANPAMTINSVIAGTTALTKSGPGGLILNGSNTYSGITYLNGGATTLTNPMALQNSTVSFDLQAGTLLFGSTITNATVGGLSGNQTVSLTNAASGAVALTVGNSTTNSTYSGNMTGLGSLIKAGTDTLTLSGSFNSYTGTTNINAGTLLVTGSILGTGAVGVNAGGTLSGTGTIAGPVTVAGGVGSSNQGSISLVNGSIGTLTLQSGLTVGSGTSPSNLSFDINATTADTLALGSSTFTVNAGGASINVNSLVSGSSIVSGTTYTLMTFASGTGPGFVTGSGSTTQGALTLADPVLTFGVSGTLNVTSTAVQVVTSVSSAPGTAYWSGVQGSTWNATDGTLTNGNFTTDSAGANFVHAYPGPSTNVIFSAIGNGAPTNLTNTLGINFDINSLTFLSTNTAATSIGGTNQLTLEGGGITVQSGAGAVTLSMANLVLDANQTWNNSSATPLIVSSKVSGTGGLTTIGNISMTGTNTYNGSTTVTSGTLQLGGGGSLTSPGNLTVSGGTLDVDGSNVTIATLSGSGTITNSAAASGSATLTSNANADSTFSGVISDSGAGKTLALVKNGANSLTLSGGNSFVGGTTLNAGTIVVGNATALGNGGPLTVNGGTLDLEADGSGAGGSQAISVGSLSGTGGTITDNNGVAGTTTLNVNQTVAGAYVGTINNGASRQLALSKSGAATLTLTNIASNYGSGTTISAGEVLSAAPGTIGSGNVNLSGGVLSLGTLSGFGGSGSGWTVNSNNTGGTSYTSPVAITSNILTLTDNHNTEARFAFFDAPQTITSNGFVANFTYTPSANKAADGFAFVVENDPRGPNIINGNSGTLGYQGTANSGAVEFNIYTGASGGIGTAFGTTATPLPANTSVSPVSLGGGDPIQVNLTYNGSNNTVTEILTDAVANTTKTTVFSSVNYNTLLGGGTSGYVGFTGAAGGLTSTQTISNFSFESLASETWANNLVASASVASGIEVGVGSATAGTLAMQSAATLNVTGAATLATNTAYGLTVGATNLNGVATFNVANNGTGVGTLTLGALNDGSVTSTINTSGAGAVTLGSTATSLVDGTAVNVGSTSTVNVNATGGLGTQADVTVASGGTVTLGANQSFGSLNGGGSVNISSNALTVGGTSTINPNSNYSGAMLGVGNFTVGGGTFTLTSAGRVASTNVTVNTGATANINGLLTGTPAVTINGTATLGVNDGVNGTTGSILTRTWGALTVGTGANLSIAPTTLANHASRTVLVAASVSNSGKIDLSNNALVDQNAGDASTIIGQLQASFNSGWNGSSGIASTTAAADSSHLTALGYFIADGTTSFEGMVPPAGSIEVKYTYYGDANLDGAVDGSDYELIDNGFNNHLTGWQNGDFNYDGVVDGSDYTLIDNAFNTQSATLGTNPLALIATNTSQIAGGTSAVPEPTTLGLLGIGAVGLLAKRRRRN